MNNTCPHPVLHHGTAQTDRLLRALIPTQLELDPRRTEDMMVLAARFSKHLQYWQAENNNLKADGDWSSFWECDHLFFLALVASLDVEGLERAFKKAALKALRDAQTLEDEGPCDPDPCPENMRGLIDMAYQMAALINEWGEKASAHPDMQKDFAAAVRSDLGETLQALIAFDKATLPAVNDYDPFIYDCNPPEAFAVNWALGKTDYIKIQFRNPCQEPFASVRTLQAIATRFIAALLRLRGQAAAYLQAVQDGTQRRHQPHIALFFAFLHLFRHLQNQLNGLTQKHLDHYYQRILHLERRRQLPDRAHLVFQLAQGVVRHTLEPGTAFMGGKDAGGADRTYALERSLSLNQAKVAEIRTLYQQHIIKENKAPAISLYEHTILDTDKDSPAPKKIEQVLPFYPLGKGGAGSLAETGLAIASAELLTSQANRWIGVTFQFQGTPTLIKDPSPLLEKILSKEDQRKIDLENIWKGQKINDNEWNDYIQPNLAKIFNIEIRTTEGWLKIEDIFKQAPEKKGIIEGTVEIAEAAEVVAATDTSVAPALSKTSTNNTVTADELSKSVNFDGKKSQGTLELRIGKAHPATAAPVKGLHGDRVPDTPWPVLKVTLNREFLGQDGYEIMYGFLSQVKVDAVVIQTSVTDVTDFKLVAGSTRTELPETRNLDVNQLAGRGVYLYSEELFNRSLFSASTIALKGEPIEPRVKSLYWDGDDVKNSLFKSTLFAQINTTFDTNVEGTNKSWKEVASILTSNNHSQKAKALSLFRRTPHKKGARYLLFDFQREGYVQGTPAILEANYAVANFPLAGNLNPVFTDISIDYQSFQIIFQKEPQKFENTIKDSNFYKTLFSGTETKADTSVGTPRHRFDDSLDQIFYLAPHGGYYPVPNLHTIDKDNKAAFPLIPLSEGVSQGNLYIGLQQARPLQTQSLLFQVIEGTEEEFSLNTPDIEWHYLKGNVWKKFPSSAILYDSTKADTGSKRSLVQSGIVELAIPKDATDNDTLLRPGFIWVRASGIEVLDKTSVLALPKLLAIHAQAGRVQLSDQQLAASHFAQPLPPETISQLRLRQAAVRKTEQRYPGFDGRAFEPDNDYYRRVSERLRHRGRALTVWDMERLTLEQFPRVRAVKCLQHTQQPDDDQCANGHVTVAVLPRLRNPEYENPVAPQPSAALLENIKGYLRGRANLFVSHIDKDKTEYLHVVRPHYQEIAVAISVRFRLGIADDETLMMRLDRDIAAYIAPWAYDEGVAPRFGTSLYRTDLLLHLEALAYVDYIETLLIGVVEREDDGVITAMDFLDEATKPAQRISPKYGRSILSSFQREEGKEVKLGTWVSSDNTGFNWPKTQHDTILFKIGKSSGATTIYTIPGKDPYTPHHFIKVITA